LTLRLGLILCVLDPAQARDFLEKTDFFEENYSDKAVAILSAISFTPFHSADQWVQLGKAVAGTGEWGMAEAIFQKAVRLKPENAGALSMLGLAKEQNGEDGQTELLRAEGYDPHNNIVLANMAEYYSRHGNFTKAIDYYTELHKNQSEEPIWDIELGRAFAQAGDMIKAYEFYVAAIDQQPENVNYWIAMVNFCVQYQVYLKEVGLPAARKAVSLAPDNSNALASMGIMLLMNGDADSAIRFSSMQLIWI